MYPRSSFIVSLFLLAPLAYPAPLPQEQDPLRFQATPGSPQNKTCSAADTECVVGNLTDPPEEGPPHDTSGLKARGTCKASDTDCVVGNLTDKPAEGPPTNTSHVNPGPAVRARDAETEDETAQHGLRKRQSSLNEVSSATGIDEHNADVAAPKNTTSNSTEPAEGTSRVCSAADVDCVVAKRRAQPEPLPEASPEASPSTADEDDDITLRIRALQAELDTIRSRRSEKQPRYDPIEAAIEHAKRQTAASEDPIAAAQAFADVVAQTIRNSTTGTAQSASGTASPLPVMTNAWGRRICKASDVDCVVNGS